MIQYMTLALIWLSVSSVAVTVGRMIANPVVAYPVAALVSFAVLFLVTLLFSAASSFGLLTVLDSMPFPSGNN